ncbi:VanZ family protein [Lysobacter sp. CAU 1642]|uniref:VanZ family protein n=1 Tax=Pseudomarimonas salicorniae TaxID=2933270 RepID=A0ABT0GED2_9GAMM|nr:VanZ family protein [Lysobacter sp. CAU 1642]
MFRRPRARALAVLWLLCFGALVEATQALLPWRSAEIGDLLANALGTTLGTLLAFTALPAAWAALEVRLARLARLERRD